MVRLKYCPTAQASVAETAATPDSTLPRVPPGLGLGTCVHLVPFQCSIKVRLPPALDGYEPTAQASLAEVAATEISSLPAEGLGLGTCVQAVPFQCSAKVRTAVPVPVS